MEHSSDNANVNELNSKFSSTFTRKRIKLNVGGKLFETSISTLTNNKSKFFTAMFSGRWDIPKEEDGCFFIDRDPFAFHRNHPKSLIPRYFESVAR